MNHVGLILDEEQWSSLVPETPAFSIKVARANVQISHPSALKLVLVQPLVALPICYKGKLHFLQLDVDSWGILCIKAPSRNPAGTCAGAEDPLWAPA